MGKIRVKTFGDEAAEEATKAEEAVKREQKDLRSGKAAKVAGIGMKGGERTTSLGVSEEEIAASLDVTPTASEEDSRKSKTKRTAKVVSLRHKENKTLGGTSVLKVAQAVETLRKFKAPSFDETVELHINTKEKGISGTVMLPHGTGKKLTIVIADEAVIDAVSKGNINFDILVAHPSLMPQLARVAKILGPRGLMPNPKNGTISPNPEDAVKKLSAGQVGFKTESGAPLIHMSVGKMSFDDKKLTENITTAITAIGSSKISAVTLKSTMSPAVKVHISSK